jgi:hypothetical protein
MGTKDQLFYIDLKGFHYPLFPPFVSEYFQIYFPLSWMILILFTVTFLSSSGTTEGRQKYVPFTDHSARTTLQIFSLAAAYRSRFIQSLSLLHKHNPNLYGL